MGTSPQALRAEHPMSHTRPSPQQTFLMDQTQFLAVFPRVRRLALICIQPPGATFEHVCAPFDHKKRDCATALTVTLAPRLPGRYASRADSNPDARWAMRILVVNPNASVEMTDV